MRMRMDEVEDGLKRTMDEKDGRGGGWIKENL